MAAALPPILLKSASQRSNVSIVDGIKKWPHLPSVGLCPPHTAAEYAQCEAGIAPTQAERGEGGSFHKLQLQRSAPFRSERPGLERLPTSIDPHHCLRPQGSVMSLPGSASDVYQLGDVIGRGAFGTVIIARRRGSSSDFALKTILKSKVDDTDLFERELAVARRLKHPYIVKLHETFRDESAYHLVMDLCTGGDLLDLIRGTLADVSSASTDESGASGHGGLPAREVGRFAGQMLKGIAYLHNYQFAHRDIKPENYLLEGAFSPPRLKLVDFGLARSFKGSNQCHRGSEGGCKQGRMTTKVGSVCYVAPEVITSNDGYDSKCDIWSAGITLWVMAVASRPFDGRKVSDYIRDVLRRQPPFLDQTMWGRHPMEVQRVVSNMLALEPRERPCAADLLKSEAWLRKETIPGLMEGECCCSLQ